MQCVTDPVYWIPPPPAEYDSFCEYLSYRTITHCMFQLLPPYTEACLTAQDRYESICGDHKEEEEGSGMSGYEEGSGASGIILADVDM